MDRQKQAEQRKISRSEKVMLAWMYVMPLLAIAVVIYGVIVATVPDQLSLGAAIAVGTIAGIVGVVLFTVTSGSDMMDLIMGSFWVIVFALMLMPVFRRAKETAARRRMRQQNPPAQMQRRPSAVATEPRALNTPPFIER